MGRSTVANGLAWQLSKVGVKLALDPASSGRIFQERLEKREFDLAFVSLSSDYLHPHGNARALCANSVLENSNTFDELHTLAWYCHWADGTFLDAIANAAKEISAATHHGEDVPPPGPATAGCRRGDFSGAAEKIAAARGRRHQAVRSQMQLSGTSEPNPDTDAQCLRKKIQNEKIDAERRDLLGIPPPADSPPPDPLEPFPFASFAKGWDVKYGKDLELLDRSCRAFQCRGEANRAPLRRRAEIGAAQRAHRKDRPSEVRKKGFRGRRRNSRAARLPDDPRRSFDSIKKDRKDKTAALTRDHLKELWKEGLDALRSISEYFRSSIPIGQGRK